ncbi:MAG: T9SS type A sorting domain-containing protein [Flavobacteriales bacterium]|nr:T9SS type A sorting domain-containing protein [Flavobacteriales bacterium]
MKLTTLSAALTLATALSTQAQITIVQSDLPAVNNPWERSRAVPNPLLSVSGTGPNYTWNYTNLHAQEQETEVYQSVSSTNLVYALVYADLGFNPNRANLAKAGVEIAFADLLPVENPYTFRYRSSSVYKTVGFGLELAGIPVPVIFQEHDVVYQLPLNYGNTSSSYSRWNLDVPTLAYYGYEQVRNNVVDGWGTVNTPAGSFQALRVKSTIDGRDTIQVDELSLGFAIDRPRITEYKWLAKNIRVPVLQINTVRIGNTEVITEVFFYDLPRSITVDAPLSTSLCPGASVAVNYTKTGSYNQGGFFLSANIFRAQLSDANGDFTNPVTIGSVTSTQSGTINATIPLNTPPGNGYRIRVIATSPAFTGTDNGTDISIGELPLASITAAGPTVFCEGGSVELSAPVNGGYSYQWNLNGQPIAAAQDATLEVDQPGNYTVQVSNACGNANSTAQTVVVNAEPEHAFTQSDYFTCAGLATTLEVTDLSGQGNMEYQWFVDGTPVNSAGTSTLQATQAGSYSVLATNTATGCSYLTMPATLEVELVPEPTVLALNSTTFCEGGSVELTALGSTSAYLWFMNGQVITGADSETLTTGQSGSYTAAAVSDNGCISQPANFIAVQVNALPDAAAISAAGATAFCAGESVELGTNEQALSYQWLLDGTAIAGADTQQLNADAPGSYTLLITDVNGCTSAPSNNIEVVVYTLPEAAVISTDNTSICAGSSTMLEAAATSGLQLQWLLDGNVVTGANGNTLSASEAGTYSMIALSSEGCLSGPSNSITIEVLSLPDAPTLGADGPTAFCAGGNVLLLVDGNATGTLQWTLNGTDIPGANDTELSASVGGDYSAWLTDDQGCNSAPAEAITVTVNAIPATPAVQAAGATTFCAGGSLSLSYDAGAGASYQWSVDGETIDGADGSTFLATEAGAYSLQVSSAEGCTSEVSPAITVVVNEVPAAPQIEIEGATTFCAGGNAVLSADGGAGTSYQWSLNGSPITGADGASITVTEAGSYSVQISTSAGCSSAASAAVEITVNPLPAAPVITQNVGTLSTAASGSLQWYLNGNALPNATGSSIEASQNGNYTVVVTDANGCSNTSEIFAFNSVGLSEVGAASWNVYPNPSNGNFFISVPNAGLSATYYTVHDATGKLVLQGALTSTVSAIQLPDAQSGMYFLRIVQQDESSTRRIVVGR